MRLYPRTRHDLVPEEKEQNDDRNWNAEQPEKCASSHSCLLLCEGQRRGLIEVPLHTNADQVRDEALLL